MKYNISEQQAARILKMGDLVLYDDPAMHPLYHRIGEVFPHLKAEYSYLDWEKFNESKGEENET